MCACSTNETRHRRGVQLLAKTANAFRLRDWTLTEIDPDGLRHVGHTLAWLHWAFIVFGLFQILYRPSYGYWAAQFVAYLLILVLLAAFNGYFHYLVLSKRAKTWRLVLALFALDVILISLAVAIDGGFSSYHFHLVYYPPLAFLAVVITSFRLTMALVTMVAATYLALCLAAGDGLDFEAKDERVLLTRIFVMYLISVLVNLISRFERSRWSQAVKREQELVQERVEVSQVIHDTAAQSAYVLGLGIDTARMLAGQSSEELNRTLAAASMLSKSIIWELRRPVEGGLIFEGNELGQTLRAHTERFGSIASVSVEVVQLGDEPPLPVETRSRLFTIAHNALSNALLHSRADRVRVALDFRGDLLLLSVSDNGVGLPDDRAERGRGIAGMRADAERMGGRLILGPAGPEGGTVVTCEVPR